MVAFNRRFVLTVLMLGACALAGGSCSSSKSSGGGSGGASAGSGGAPAEAGSGGARAGTGGATVDAGSVELIESDAGQLIMPLPVLDPTGTYGGKTYPEWGAEWMKWILEYPGPESLAFNTPGAHCEMGQSMAMGSGSTDAPPFFLGIFDLGGPGGGTFTQACTVPIGRTILFQMYADWDTTIPGCVQETEQECLAGRSLLASATKIDLEIDGKSTDPGWPTSLPISRDAPTSPLQSPTPMAT